MKTASFERHGVSNAQAAPTQEQRHGRSRIRFASVRKPWSSPQICVAAMILSNSLHVK